MHGGSAHDDMVTFGSFRLNLSARRLEVEGKPVALTNRAMDVLIILVEKAGTVVAKEELLAQPFPNGSADVGVLRVYISAIRKALQIEGSDARFLATVSGQGYCFVAPVQRLKGTNVTEARIATAQSRIPTQVARLVGREQAVNDLLNRLRNERFVTVVGPGGIGKTTVALSVSHALLKEFDGEVYFFDLGSLHDHELVPTVIAAAFGLLVRTVDPTRALVDFLAERRMLVVFDSCEHVIDSLSALAELLYADAPRLHILATSRERLRVEGEHVYRLMPLEHPADGYSLTAVEALTYPSIQLFVEHASASDGRFALDDLNAPFVADICRKLDGIPLAIELAAKRASTHGVSETASMLDSQFELIWKGRRTAAPRHQTLRATIDWSYNLLSDIERTTLCRISVFSGPFTLDAACTIVSDSDNSRTQIITAINSLVAKSLLSSLVPPEKLTGFRLLDTTRQYAMSKLRERGDTDLVTQRHIRYFSALLKSTKQQGSITHSKALELSPHLENIRKALSCSFAAIGSEDESVDLAVNAVPLLLELSLYVECRSWCQKALEIYKSSGGREQQKLELRAALATSLLWTHNIPDEIGAEIKSGVQLSSEMGERTYQIRFLIGLNIAHTGAGRFVEALDAATRCAAIAYDTGVTAEIAVAEWVLGAAYHFAGNQVAAIHHCEQGYELARDAPIVPASIFGFNHRARADVVMARASWLRGRSDEAYELATRIIHDKSDSAPPISRSIAVLYTIPVLLWLGRFEEAVDPIERAIATSRKSPFPRDWAIGQALRGELLVARGEISQGVDVLKTSLQTLQSLGLHIATPPIACALASGLLRLDQPDEALAIINDQLLVVETRGNIFWLPSLLRSRGEILLALPRPNIAAAESSLRSSIDHARRQFALAWEILAAIPLARFLAGQKLADEARSLLVSVIDQFGEGSENRDLAAARKLLDEIEEISV
ncbi:ATP-binding protein [Tardiphaga sp. 866_E4_N2_1]|uniref:ATP-binding protein n=1 Tax=unclassified Tardiphaga TaxID=2631404 RepID=UPI003F1FBAC9